MKSVEELLQTSLWPQTEGQTHIHGDTSIQNPWYFSYFVDHETWLKYTSPTIILMVSDEYQIENAVLSTKGQTKNGLQTDNSSKSIQPTTVEGGGGRLIHMSSIFQPIYLLNDFACCLLRQDLCYGQTSVSSGEVRNSIWEWCRHHGEK